MSSSPSLSLITIVPRLEDISEVLNKRLLEQISGGQVQEDTSRQQNSATERGKNNTVPSTGGGDLAQGKFQRCIAEGDLDFVSTLDRLCTFIIHYCIKSFSRI